ncbi:MAG: beta-ketothiolase BktB [Methylobacterium sp.]
MTMDVFVLGAVRSAIGGFGGGLAGFSPAALGAAVAREAIRRAGVSPDEVGHVVIGNVIPTGPEDAHLSRAIGLAAGIPREVPALNVSRLCGSGAQALVSAAQGIALGDGEVALAGGTECMSRAPHYLTVARFGQKMGDAVLADGLTGVLTDPFGSGIMGVTAENIAERWGLSREMQDAFALESQRRAALAIANGHFRDQILPLETQVGRKTVLVEQDEHPRPTTTAEQLAKLPTIFKKGGTVTAGNASGVNDGAAAIILASGRRARAGKPLARVLGYAHAGVDPAIMGTGPIPAVRALLARTGLKAEDFDVIESNEAFAAQALCVNRELGLDPAKVNPDGGAIALGHPVGATGAILVVKALSCLQRTNTRKGLITMCIGGGQGIALAIERV